MRIERKASGIYMIEFTNGEYIVISRRVQQCYEEYPNRWYVSYSDDLDGDLLNPMIDTKREAVAYAKGIISELKLTAI